MVVSPQNVPRVKPFFWGYVLKIVTGSRYLGVFVGTEAAHSWWLKLKVKGWISLVAIMARVAGKHLHISYVGLQKSLQQEWDFVQRINMVIGTSFQPI